MDRYRRWIADRFTVAVMIPDQNRVVWETVNALESDWSSEFVQKGSEMRKLFGGLYILTVPCIIDQTFL